MAPALQPTPGSITLKQYEALPEEKRVEVFDGTAYDMASPSEIHQTISTELTALLHTYMKSKQAPCKVFHAPFDVKLNDEPLTIVQPDLLIVCDKDKLDGKRCNGAPDFVIEIVSPGNPADDYIRKLYYYKNYGVREYWIIDPQQKKVIVYYLSQTDFKMDTYTIWDNIKVNIFDGLYINFGELDFGL